MSSIDDALKILHVCRRGEYKLFREQSHNILSEKLQFNSRSIFKSMSGCKTGSISAVHYQHTNFLRMGITLQFEICYNPFVSVLG